MVKEDPTVHKMNTCVTIIKMIFSNYRKICFQNRNGNINERDNKNQK